MTTPRRDPLLAIDSSQSAQSAEGGSGDKDRFNSICCECLPSPRVNGISRLDSQLHRSEAWKTRKDGENYVTAQFPFDPQRRYDNSGALLSSPFLLIWFPLKSFSL